MLPGSSFVGQGEIWHKQRYVATVDYRIQLWQLPAGDEGLPGCPQVTEAKADLAGGTVALLGFPIGGSGIVAAVPLPPVFHIILIAGTSRAWLDGANCRPVQRHL